MASDKGKGPARAGSPKPARPGSETEGSRSPMPVRSSLQQQDTPAAPATAEEPTASVQVDGVKWTARVDGRGRTGSRPADAALLLVGFYASPDADRPHREAWVAARGLAEVNPERLEVAFREGRPRLDPDRPRPLFPGTSTRGRKGG